MPGDVRRDRIAGTIPAEDSPDEGPEDLIESFRNFALERLERGNTELSIDELYDCWRRENTDEEQVREDLLAVKASLRDMEQGERGRPFDEFAREFRTRRRILDAE